MKAQTFVSDEGDGQSALRLGGNPNHADHSVDSWISDVRVYSE
jgi:hypothetical protein